MGYVEFLVQTPWFWVSAAALSFAAAVRCFLVALLPRRRSRNGGQASSAAGLFLLSIALVLLTLGVFVPGPQRILDPTLLLFAALVVAVGVAAFLFPLLAGLPLILLLTLLLVLLSGYLQSWSPVHEPGDLAHFRLLSAREGRMVVEIIGRDELQWDEPLGRTVEMQGTALGASVDLLELHPAYFLLGRRYSFRLHSLRGYTFDHSQGTFVEADARDLGSGAGSEEPAVKPQSSAATSAPNAASSLGSRLEFLIRQGFLPGMRAVLGHAPPRRVGVLTTYALHLTPPDRLTIESRN